jgi:hypothetical protein
VRVFTSADARSSRDVLVITNNATAEGCVPQLESNRRTHVSWNHIEACVSWSRTGGLSKTLALCSGCPCLLARLRLFR